MSFFKIMLLPLLRIICFISLVVTVTCRPQFNIGVIFENSNSEGEIAFRSAVDRVNIYERSFELVPIFQYADIEDSFVVEKTVCNLTAQGVIAIFGPNNAGGSGIISSMCNTLEIPHITFDWSPTEALADREFASMTLNVHPDNLVLARAMADVVQGLSWRSYTIIYESEKELMQIQEILQINDPKGNPTTIRQLGPGPDYRPFLKRIKLSGESCLILHCSQENILSILKQADELKMLGEYQSIFIPSLDVHTLDFQELQNVAANITTVRIMDPTDFHVKNAVHEWEEREKGKGKYYKVLPTQVKTNMLLISDALWVFAKGLAELGIAEDIVPPKVECKKNKPWPFGRRIVEFIKARSEEASTGRIDFNEYGQRNYFTVHVLELSNNGFLELAVWDTVNGLDIAGDDDINAQRVGEKLANKTFVVTSRLGAPFLIKRVPKEGEILEGNARYEGYSMDLIDNIAQILGFKYVFELAPDGKYGSFNKVTKQWDGLVKQLLDGNADLGICDLTMTSARRQVVDFTPPFMTLGISILFAKSESPPPDLFSFLSPFSLDVWIYMATAYLGVSLLLFAFSRMAPDDWENPHPCKEPEEVENIWSIMNTTWLTMGSIMGQGCDILPKAASTRLVTGMWWFFALMMLNSYTANLAAFLTNARMDNSIESAEDLASQSKIKYGAVTGGSTMGFFRDSNFSTYQKMWATMESARPSVFTKSNDEGVERVLKGKRLYAYLMESTTLEYIIERNCDLVQVGGWLDYKTYGIAMPFNSPYRKQISKAVLKLGEAGTLAEIKRKWWKEKHGGGRCALIANANADTPELGIENVGGVFLVLGLGLLSSILIGLVEFLWNVKAVAIDEKISLLEALKLETMFAIQFWITTKPVRQSSGSSSSSSKSSSKSLGASSHSINSNGKTVSEKLRKISSMFSLKSLKSNAGEADKDNKEKIRDRDSRSSKNERLINHDV